jgi:hypothetical protein
MKIDSFIMAGENITFITLKLTKAVFFDNKLTNPQDQGRGKAP